MEKISPKAKRFLPGNPNARNLRQYDTCRISINRSLETRPRRRREALIYLRAMWLSALPRRTAADTLGDERRPPRPIARHRPEQRGRPSVGDESRDAHRSAHRVQQQKGNPHGGREASSTAGHQLG
jgi:hypothetical protein